MELSKYVACICEGAAEQAVIEMLLDEDKLIFTYDDLLEGEVIIASFSFLAHENLSCV